jgi:hypothetical protein
LQHDQFFIDEPPVVLILLTTIQVQRREAVNRRVPFFAAFRTFLQQ